MKTGFFFFTLLSISFHSLAQSTAKNALYLELGGAAIAYSLNYERTIFNGSKINTNARVGFAIFPLHGDQDINDINDINYLVPLGLNFVFGNKKRHFETGLNYTFGRTSSSSTTTNTLNGVVVRKTTEVNQYFSNLLLPYIGYRYQKQEGGFLFKLNAMPVISLDKRSNFFTTSRVWPLWLGFSFGKAF